MRRVCSCIVVIACVACAAFAQSTSADIQGVVSESGGKALSGAYVTATPIGSAGGASLTAVTGTGGNFSFHCSTGAPTCCASKCRG